MSSDEQVTICMWYTVRKLEEKEKKKVVGKWETTYTTHNVIFSLLWCGLYVQMKVNLKITQLIFLRLFHDRYKMKLKNTTLLLILENIFFILCDFVFDILAKVFVIHFSCLIKKYISFFLLNQTRLNFWLVRLLQPQMIIVTKCDVT